MKIFYNENEDNWGVYLSTNFGPKKIAEFEHKKQALAFIDKYVRILQNQ